MRVKRLKKSEFAGTGCLLQGVGVLCPFLGYAFGAMLGGYVVGVLGAGIGVCKAEFE